MVLQTHQSIKTTDEFIAYALLPENAARNLEFINGKVIEKLGSTTQNAQIPLLLSATVITHCDSIISNVGEIDSKIISRLIN